MPSARNGGELNDQSAKPLKYNIFKMNFNDSGDERREAVLAKEEMDHWVEHMDAFRAKLRALRGRIPAQTQMELQSEFEQLMQLMRETFDVPHA